MAALFRASASAPALYALELDASAPGAYWAGFCLRSGPGGGSLSLAESWGRDGIYVFADTRPEDLAVFADLLASLLGRVDPLGDVRALWIEGAAGARQVLGVLRTKPGSGVIAAPCQLAYRGYGVVLNAGCSIAPADGGERFTITPGRDGSIALTTRAGLGRLPADAQATATLPMTGAAVGTVRFPLTLAPGEGERPPDLDLLDTGLRYFVGAAQDPAVELVLDHTLSALSYPVFDPAGGPVQLHLQFDPLRPLDHDRSHLAFIAPDATTSEVDLLTHFVDRLGKQIALRPVVAGGHPRPRLVFCLSPVLGPGDNGRVLEAGGEVSAYLCPEGTFEIVAGGRSVTRVLTGLSGNEYLGFEAETGNRLIFVADQPAYAGAFRYPTGDQDEAAEDTALLSNHATTAHLYFEGGSDKRTVYYAQPDDALLWKTGRPDAFLESMELDAGVLPAPLDGDVRRAVPLVPYRGVPAERAELMRAFELGALAQARRAALFEYTGEQYERPSLVGAPVATPDAVAATTLGLLAEFDPSTNVWKSLTLAMPADRVDPLQLAGAGGVGDADGIRGPLRAALQTNQLFMVVTGAQFETYGSLVNAIVGIAGWSFDLNPSVWDQHGTILIFKFNAKPLTELLEDTTAWAHPEVFNDDPEGTRQKLLAIIADASRPDQDDAGAFAELNRIVSTAQWQGILAVNVELPLSGLPDAIAGLAAGIDPAEFYAHHVGVTLAPIEYEDREAVPTMEPSSHFGLIYYRDPNQGELPGDPYDFRVETLIVRFYNSIVVDFSSTVKLKVAQLFGDDVGPNPFAEPGAATDDDTTLILEGVLERHDGADAYTFATYEPKFMALDSGVVHDVTLDRVEMKTQTAPGVGGGPLHAYFQLRGAIRFVVQEGFDAFAFGVDDLGEPSGGLSFTRMLLHLRAELPAAGESADDLVTTTWEFDVSELVPDEPASTIRSQSLLARFPLKLTGLLQGAEGTTPQSGGFLPVNTPNEESSLTYPWYGLLFSLSLGTMGALVSNKDFSAELLVAWAPNGSEAATFVGLRLPGSDGAQKTFRIQGLFEMALSDIDLFVSQEASGTAYTMIWRNIGFQVLRLKLPPGGGVDFVLFGDPSATGKSGSLGWYLAYAKEVEGS